MAKTKTKKMDRNKKIGVTVGIAAAAAAAAAGAYFLYGKDGAKNRRKVKGWMLKARGEVLERMEALDQISQDKYHQIVDSVIRGYKSAKDASPAELAAAAAELKSHWGSIQRSFRSAKRAASGKKKTGGAAKKSGAGKAGSKKR
jgi:hypothetical protein